MGIERISSRAVIGAFYATLEQETGVGWVNDLGMHFNSDQETEEYAWLGNVPAMREWVGGRHAKGFSENKITLRNKHFEATIEILVKDLRRDKSGQAIIRIQELATRALAHWGSLLSTLIVNGASGVCYDQQYFFDTDHEEDDSGQQSNKIDVDISALPSAIHGLSVTAPSIGEIQQTILKGIIQILKFKDNQGEPMNEMAKKFTVMVPMSLYPVASEAINVPPGTDLSQQGLPSEFKVTVVPNTRLDAWTDKFAVFRTDGRVRAFIRQDEDGIGLKAKAEGSDFEFDNDAHQYGVDTWRNVAYGYWQHGCLVTMT